MPHADTLTVVHHDDTRTRYKDVRYQLVRDGIRIWSDEGEHALTDILMTHAYRQREATEEVAARRRAPGDRAPSHVPALRCQPRRTDSASLLSFRSTRTR